MSVPIATAMFTSAPLRLTVLMSTSGCHADVESHSRALDRRTTAHRIHRLLPQILTIHLTARDAIGSREQHVIPCRLHPTLADCRRRLFI
jgi:hypothetical protein